ncbi:MAG: 2-oxo acid dehydrogenase subunit E2 [Granulosicoccus sp.]|nr:2-oxo acid dehydrogenase subunit E2 [Granulosicoccus sp.]
MAEFLMPSLGSDMETGTLIEWQKKPGDTVSRGDIVAVVETQKGAIEIEAYDDGVLESHLVDIGKPVPVGTPLAIIQTPDSGVKSAPDRATTAPTQASGEISSPREPVTVDVAGGLTQDAARGGAEGGRQKISPAARKLAAELDIDITRVSGSGPQGAIVLRDVRSGAQRDERGSSLADSASRLQDGTVGTAAESTTLKTATSEMRSAIAAAMARSKREIPHYYLSQTLDISCADQWLATLNSERDPSQRILLGALLLKAVATACVKYPEFNGTFDNGVFSPAASVHAGMAINLRGGGLVAPAIHDTHELDIDGVMIRMRDLIQRVRGGRFRASELADPTITVSSLGERGVQSLYGVIYPPQVAIVGFGTPTLRPWVGEGGVLEARLLMDMTLAADHRVSDGHRGALFLRHIRQNIESPGDL